MKKLNYISLIALMIWNVPLLAMNAQDAVEIEQGKKAAEKIQKAFRKWRGQGIKVFGSEQNPIPLKSHRK